MADQVDEFFGASAATVAAVARVARRLVLDVCPDAIETLDRPDGIVAYATGPRAMKDLWAGVAPHRAHVNLQLANGALVDDPAGVIEGTGKRVRHVELHTVADVARPDVRDVVERSLARHLADSR